MAINNTGSRRLLVTLTALFAALCGLYLLIGGGWLVAIGGSWYYPIAGLVMLGVAWMLWRSKRAALWLYAALLLGTMIWGVWEVGFDFWALTPRSDILVFFGIWLILPFVWRRLVIPASGAVAALVVALLISGGILTWAGFNDPQEISGTLSADTTPAEAISPVADQDWPAYGRNQEGQRFSPLKQINADNVHKLKEAWVFRTGDVKQPKDAKGTGTESGIQPQYGVPYGVTLNPFLSPFGLPCKQPAWGYISALDLKTNEVVWKKRIGTPQDSMPFPMPVPVPFNMGMPMLGGPISTAGNVLFIAATADNYLRAYNMSNGEKLWQGRLPAGGQATPMTYEVNGKQYVVISAGGHGSFGTKMGDYIVAYALPDDVK